jgi:hypothetical protein
MLWAAFVWPLLDAALTGWRHKLAKRLDQEEVMTVSLAQGLSLAQHERVAGLIHIGTETSVPPTARA